MKRSKMVEIIAKIIFSEYENKGGFSEDDADKILTAIEQAGMQPPCRSDFGGHGILINGSCDDYIECCNFSWEKEDETS